MAVVLTKRTYLEMHSPPRGLDRQAAAEVRTLSVERPSIEQYRQWYNAVGEDFQWSDRNLIPDVELEQILQDDRVEIYLLQVDGQTAGYVQLDRRTPGEIEIAYFGLFPRYIGRGLGKAFLHWALLRCWSYAPNRVWVHTCNLDHEAALANYYKAGFTVFDEKMIEQIISLESVD